MSQHDQDGTDCHDCLFYDVPQHIRPLKGWPDSSMLAFRQVKEFIENLP